MVHTYVLEAFTKITISKKIKIVLKLHKTCYVVYIYSFHIRANVSFCKKKVKLLYGPNVLKSYNTFIVLLKFYEVVWN